MKIEVSPSLLSADFTKLDSEIESISNADLLHLDIMDGVFVPPITFGSNITAQIKKITEIPIDAHLMVSNPELQIPQFIDAGADYITFHYEATNHPHRLLQIIKDSGVFSGISINPGTPVSVLENILPDVDIVLIMSVNPGWGGQKFIPMSLEKISKLKSMIDENKFHTKIMVDGGVNDKLAPGLASAGASMFVAGSYVFNSPDRKAAIESLKNI